MTFLVGYFLPSYANTKMAFLKAILKGEKKVLRTSQITYIPFPRYKELSVKSLYVKALASEEVKQYLPEGKMLGSSKVPEREYFHAIISTLKENETKCLVE
jgi:hypothetical protein